MALKPTQSSVEKKRQIFVEEYVRTLNATQAALAAGYKGVRARQRGWELLHDPDLSRQIETALAQRTQQCRVDTQLVIEQTLKLALDTSVPARDRVKALDLLGRYTQAWSGGGDTKQTTTIEVRLSD